MDTDELKAPATVASLDRLLNEKDAAKRLGMSLPWLRGRRRDKLAPVFLKLGARVLYRESDLAAFINSCAVAVRGGEQ